MKRIALLTATAVLFSLSAPAADFIVELTATGGAIVKVDGKLFAEYVVDQANKPYLWPIVGPTGKEMTRSYPMKDVPGEKQDHPHHRGLNFGHESIAGYDTWAELATFGKNPKTSERVQHLGAGRFWGRFNDVSGKVMFDRGVEIRMDVAIRTESVDSGNKDLDKHLMSPDFFNAKEPSCATMSFKSTGISLN